MFDVMDMGATGLLAQRLRLETIAQNIANVNTTEDAAGQANPYRRRFVVFAPGAPGDPSKPGVRVTDVVQDPSPFNRRYEPGHKNAGPDGYVNYPNVDVTVEHVNALEATRAYEANATMIEVSKSMFTSALRLIA
jgi:flagellar basal-body rod protein FlgC